MLKPIVVFSILSLFAHSQAHAFGGRKMEADPSGKFKIAGDVKEKQFKLILKDLARLEKSDPKIVSEDMKKIMGLTENAKAPELVSWLHDRFEYIVGERFNASRRAVVLQKTWAFENDGPEHKPQIEYPKMLDSHADLLEQQAEAQEGDEVEISLPPHAVSAVTIMSNIGAAVYYAGKEGKKLYGLRIPGGDDVVPMTSPRSGVIQVGEGLFMPLLEKRGIKDKNIDTPAYSYTRLTTFFHEARHSDGNGKHLGFFHALCPAGHDMANLNACDRNLNGPYTVGAVMMRNFVESCTECSVQELEAMKLVYLDSENRVLRNALDAPKPDPRIVQDEKETEDMMCKLYRDANRRLPPENQMPLPAHCNKEQKPADKPAEPSEQPQSQPEANRPADYGMWNAAPEGKRGAYRK